MLRAENGIAAVLFKRQRAVLGIFLAVMMAGFAYLLIATPQYESEAQLVVTFGGQSAPTVGQAVVTQLTPGDRREIVLSHAEILKSQDLARATIEAVGLKNVYPEIAENPPPVGSEMDAAVRQFSDQLWLNVGAQSNVISIFLLHSDKVAAQKLLAKLIDLYVGQTTVVYRNSNHDFLEGEVGLSAKRLSETQGALEAFKAEWRISDYDAETTDLLRQRGEVDSNLRTAQADLGLAQQRRVNLEKLMKDVPQTLPESAGGEKFRSLDEARNRLAELRNRESQLLASYSADSPLLASLKASIAAAQTEVNTREGELSKRASSNTNSVFQTIQTDYLRAVSDSQSNAEPVRVLTEQLVTIDERLGALRKSRGAFDNLVREQQLAENTYRALATQYEDSRVKDNLNRQRISSVAVITKPTAPYKPSRPRRFVTVIICLFAGVILAVGGALLLESFDDRLTTPEQITATLNLPVLASFAPRQQYLPPMLTAQRSA